MLSHFKLHTSHVRSLLVAVALVFATAGCDGPVGPAGTANVIYSDWMDIEWNEMDTPTFKIMDIPEPMITDDFASTGTALVYIQGANGLTYNTSFSVDNISVFHVMYPPSSVIGIHAHSTNGASIDVSNFLRVRYVLIPGGVPVGGLQAGLQTESILDDYEAIKAHFSIPEEGSGVIPVGTRQ